MIRVVRTAKPDILVRKENEWLEDLRLASTAAKAKRAASRYKHPQVQEALKVMFHGKCAYCESKIAHVSSAHIEPYRPKSSPRYRDLTFDRDNLLLACGVRNSSFKKDQFPEAAEGGPLINPSEDDPESHFAFQYDAATMIASVYRLTTRGQTAEQLLGLNRPELCGRTEVGRSKGWSCWRPWPGLIRRRCSYWRTLSKMTLSTRPLRGRCRGFA